MTETMIDVCFGQSLEITDEGFITYTAVVHLNNLKSLKYMEKGAPYSHIGW